MSEVGERELAVDSVVMHFSIGDEKFLALDAASLSLEKGEFGSIIGPSGCGKSTLLRLVADILQPASGTIRIGQALPIACRKKRKIGFVFQDATLLAWRSVLQNVGLPLQIAGGVTPATWHTPEQLIKLVGLAGFEQARPSQLSGGMQQRVSIARSLVLEPDILLLDEPFGALDEISRQKMNLELLRILGETRTTALMVTHSIAEAVFMSDRVFVMSARPGRVRAEIAVPLARPRTLEMMRLPAFHALVDEVRDHLFDLVPAKTA